MHLFLMLYSVIFCYIMLYCIILCRTGNTCFMNSMLQCLSNTTLLRNYYSSSSSSSGSSSSSSSGYVNDINRDNPLGCRGELVAEYALLMDDMWGSSSSSSSSSSNSNGIDNGCINNSYPTTTTTTTTTTPTPTPTPTYTSCYPQSFKDVVGTYESQFAGYQQTRQSR